MPRARDPNRDKAYKIWKEHKGEKKLKDIAEELGVSDTQVRKWKSQDKWEQKIKGNVTIPKRNVTKPQGKPEPVIKSDELNDKQKLYCLYYLKYFNATKAYQKAYGCDYFSAKAHGYKLLQTVAVKKEIDRLKNEQQESMLLDSSAVLQKYIDIAFADITDFVEFGREEMIDDLGNPFEVNRVKFRDSSEVDGTLVTEVKQGKDGVSVKLADKMKALDFLTKYTDLLSDNDRKRLQEEKLKAEIEKLHKENSTDSKTEDKLKEYFTALGGAFRDNS